MATTVDRTKVMEYVGRETPPTQWHTVDQAAINEFADCTLDHQFIHVDPERAKQTPFGGTVAHGFLSLSMLSHFAEEFMVMIEGVHMGLNYGFDKVRFIAPVAVDSRIRARAKFIDITETKPGQFRFTTQVTIEIEGQDKPALIAEWLTMQLVA